MASKGCVKNSNVFLDISERHLKNKNAFLDIFLDVSQTFLLFGESDELSSDPKRSRYIFA